MSKKTEIDENGAERKRLFKPKSSSALEGSGAEKDILKDVLKRKQEKKEISHEVKTRRVSELLKSFSKFDEDILRLQGVGEVDSDTDVSSINELSIEQMQEELQQFLLDRERIKKNLDNLVMRVNKTSNELEQEDEKIRKLKQEIQLKTEKQFSNIGGN